MEQICLSSKLLIVMRGSSTSRLTQKSTTDVSIMMCGLKTHLDVVPNRGNKSFQTCGIPHEEKYNIGKYPILLFHFTPVSFCFNWMLLCY